MCVRLGTFRAPHAGSGIASLNLFFEIHYLHGRVNNCSWGGLYIRTIPTSNLASQFQTIDFPQPLKSKGLLTNNSPHLSCGDASSDNRICGNDTTTPCSRTLQDSKTATCWDRPHDRLNESRERSCPLPLFLPPVPKKSSQIGKKGEKEEEKKNQNLPLTTPPHSKAKEPNQWYPNKPRGDETKHVSQMNQCFEWGDRGRSWKCVEERLEIPRMTISAALGKRVRWSVWSCRIRRLQRPWPFTATKGTHLTHSLDNSIEAKFRWQNYGLRNKNNLKKNILKKKSGCRTFWIDEASVFVSYQKSQGILYF